MWYVEIEYPTRTEIYDEAGGEFHGQQVYGRVISISQITRAINKDKSIENSYAEVIFTNIDKYFDNILESEDKYIFGKTLRIYDDDTLIFTGKISEIIKTKPTQFGIRADFVSYGIDERINKAITKTEFANAPEDNVGKFANIIYGVASDEGSASKGIITAYRVDTGKYLLAWHKIKELIAVYDKDGNDITASCTLQNDDTTGYAFILYDSTDNEMYVNCKGKTDEAGNLIENPADVLEDLLTNFSDFTISGVDEAWMVYEDRGYIATVVIDDDISFRSFFEKFSKSVDNLIFQKADGSLGLKVLDWGTETPIKSIAKIYIDNSSFENWRDTEELTSKIKRMFWWHFRNKYYQRLPEDVETVGWVDRIVKAEMQYIKEDEVAKDVASRILFFKQRPVIWYAFSIPKQIGNDIDLGDVIEIEYFTGIYAGRKRYVQVFRKTYTQGSGLIRFEAMDITGINKGLIKLWDEDDDQVVLLKDESDPECNVLL